MWIDQLLERTVAMRCSDLHLQALQRPRVRSRGDLIELEDCQALWAAELEQHLIALLNDDEEARLKEQGFLDFALHGRAGHQWRVHYYRTKDGLAAAFRPLPERIRGLAELGLPDALERLGHLRSGLVLITGATGSGKSTTMAAVVDQINSTYRRSIITLEDPIESIHENKRSFIQQRQRRTHVTTYRQGILDALRERPDILVIGELRGAEAARAALTAAETGMVVFTTLHSNSATQAIDRFLDLFPHSEQRLVRVMLAQLLEAVVSQTLLHHLDGQGRVPACEVLFKTLAVSHLIEAGKIKDIRSCIQTGRSSGMQDLDAALLQLVWGGKVSRAEARAHAHDPGAFEDAYRPAGPPPVRRAWRPRRVQPRTREERRHEGRVKTIALVNVAAVDEIGREAELRTGQTLDLSHDGARVELDQPLQIRGLVQMQLALGPDLIEVRGAVCSVHETREERFQVGLKFIELTRADREVIDRYLRLRSH